MISLLLYIFSIMVQPGNSFKSELESYLRKNLSGYNDYKYEILQMPVSYKEIEIISKNDFNINGNMIYLPVKLVTKDGRVSRAILSIKLKLYRKIYVAVRAIQKNESLSTSEFELMNYDVTGLESKPLESLKELIMYRSKKLIKPGDPLTNDDIELKPVIISGNPINAIYRYGSVFISFEAFARQDGVPGETIAVITRDKKLFKAKVIDSHDVKIIE